MAAQPFRVQLSRDRTRRLYRSLSLINTLLAATTAAFILLWERQAQLSPALQDFTRHVLVQGHLATENVLAAWYSSMLLLATAVASMIAFAEDRRGGRHALSAGWLLFTGVFALLSLDEIGSFHERIGMLSGGTTAGPVGWAYLLALPILAVGLFMLAFGWFHVRRVPAAFRLLAAGVALFLMNPVLEVIEMALIHGAGATAGTWQRSVHDLLLVVEEGGLELFGILCILAAALTYIRRTAGEIIEWRPDARRVAWAVRGATLALLVGTWSARWAVARLPQGDTGIPQNWFPAAALFLAALGAPRRLAIVCVALSAFFGAGLHGYTTWHAFDALRLMLNGSLAILFGMALWDGGRARGAGRPIAAALLMTAAVTVTGEYAPLLAIAAAGMSVECWLKSADASTEASAPVVKITA